jgi:Domain of unknown function (DUF4376)
MPSTYACTDEFGFLTAVITIAGEAPPGAVALDGTWASQLSQMSTCYFDGVTWIDLPRPAGLHWNLDRAAKTWIFDLASARKNHVAQAKSWYLQLIARPLTVAGKTFDADEQSIASLREELDAGPPVRWRLADNSSATMTKVEVQAVLSAWVVRRRGMFDKFSVVKDLMRQATTEQELFDALATFKAENP